MTKPSIGKKSQSYEFGDSIVTVSIGALEESDAEVLVSSDDDHLSMAGGVSQSLLIAGGSRIRDDALKHVPAQLGDVVVTSAGGLRASYIFHAITRLDGRGRRHASDAEAGYRVLEAATKRCLERLHGIGRTSIAFPALGTGYAGYNVLDVATVMATSIVRYLKERPALQLRVMICIRPEDITSDVDFREFFIRFDERTGLVASVVREHAVVLIHGIRTEARWFETVSRILRDGDHQLHPVAAGYGYLDVIRFLLPWQELRQAPVARVCETLEAVCANPKIKRVSVIAHSFGTYIVGEILKSTSSIKLHRLLLCGSILPSNYDWRAQTDRIDPLPDRTTQFVVNDCGWKDIYPVLAESSTWGYGSAGRFGFQSPWVEDRHHGFGHSDFFEEEYVRQFWLPLLSTGTIRPSPKDRPQVSWWIQLLRVLKVRWVLWPALAAGLGWCAWLVAVNLTCS